MIVLVQLKDTGLYVSIQNKASLKKIRQNLVESKNG